MNTPRVSWPVCAACLLGVVLGWTAGSSQPARLRAGNTDRWNDRIVTTGAISQVKDKQGNLTTQDAYYTLNYSNGMLLAAVPAYQQTGTNVRLLSDFAERDLVRDFGIQPGANPHFLMTTLSLGIQGETWEPLVVVETESGQIASYRVLPQVTSTNSRPSFLLLERRTDPRLARSLAAAAGVERAVGR